ncbi:proton-coupled zinc antiporter SLC30A9, mitochondrial-like isoform X2 [Antedon mediterranea]|uniref:proton-coupled zinc antiporter SLC30A9, mitochondrial-like isoform X2 n=1 Tax=Antedon mediterranea TaxID=105859 RepID=UPI003AF62CF3
MAMFSLGLGLRNQTQSVLSINRSFSHVVSASSASMTCLRRPSKMYLSVCDYPIKFKSNYIHKHIHSKSNVKKTGHVLNISTTSFSKGNIFKILYPETYSKILVFEAVRTLCNKAPTDDPDKTLKAGTNNDSNEEDKTSRTPDGTNDDFTNNIENQHKVPEVTTEEIIKPYMFRRKKVDYSRKYSDNSTITAIRAMKEYLLKSSDLENLRKTARRSPYDNQQTLMVYLRLDVEAKALEVWGSSEALNRAIIKKKQQEEDQKENVFLLKKAIKQHDSFFGANKPTESFFDGTGKVVMLAIAINLANFGFKLLAWLYSGSASMFSEAIHSAADVCNQAILAVGINQSIKKPNPDHPYGYSNLRYVSSLISGVGIFCVGAGLSIYHGIQGLINPQEMESLLWSFCILGGSFLSEGATLMAAISHIKGQAKKKQIGFMNYVLQSKDPSVNVVLLEDTVAVIGVTVAATCMGLTSLTGSPVYDAVGSIVIGGLLGVVSTFLIYTNTEALVGRSIPQDQLTHISEALENDVMVRGVYDVKATVMGVDKIRFKAEVDFDGQEVTRSYLDGQDIESMLKDMKEFESLEQLEQFMLRHGENIIDNLGVEVDRIEKQIKKINSDVRHVDLEIL